MKSKRRGESKNEERMQAGEGEKERHNSKKGWTRQHLLRRCVVSELTAEHKEGMVSAGIVQEQDFSGFQPANIYIVLAAQKTRKKLKTEKTKWEAWTQLRLQAPMEFEHLKTEMKWKKRGKAQCDSVSMGLTFSTEEY